MMNGPIKIQSERVSLLERESETSNEQPEGRYKKGSTGWLNQLKYTP